MPNLTVPANVTPLSAIMRTAHAAACARMRPSKSYRHGDRIDRTISAYVPTARYRQIFRTELRTAWASAKSIALMAAIDAKAPIPSIEDMARAEALRARAWAQPITRTGNQRMRDLHIQAAAIDQRRRAA